MKKWQNCRIGIVQHLGLGKRTRGSCFDNVGIWYLFVTSRSAAKAMTTPKVRGAVLGGRSPCMGLPYTKAAICLDAIFAPLSSP